MLIFLVCANRIDINCLDEQGFVSKTICTCQMMSWLEKNTGLSLGLERSRDGGGAGGLGHMHRQVRGKN